MLLCSVGLLGWMWFDNRKRNEKDMEGELAGLTGLSIKQVQDLDWRHPAFRWRP